MEKIKLGISKLDQFLDGGLRQGRAYLVSGEPGTGKTTFGLQFLLEGLELSERCLYISIDERPEHIIMNAKILGWDLSPFLSSGHLEFLDVTRYFGDAKHITDQLNYDRIISNMIQFIDEKKASRLVIDPISPIILNERNNPELPYFLRRLIFKLEELENCTSLLTSNIPSGSRRLSQNGIEDILSSGVFLLRLNDSTSPYQRELCIHKMRGSNITPCHFPFKIIPKKGIVLRS